jgi:hypothetical protein
MRKPFGGLKLDFSKYSETKLKEIFPSKPINPAEMNKLLWSWIKKRKEKIFV